MNSSYFPTQPNTSKRLINKANFLLSEYFATNEISHLKLLADMFLKDELRFKLGNAAFEPILMFKEGSLYQNKCCKCEEDINIGDPIFWYGKNYWHMQCGTAEDKKQSYYLEACKKATHGDKKFAAVLICLDQDNEKQNIADFTDINSDDKKIS